MSSRGPPLNPSKTASGIAVDPRTLDRVIPESRRSDGSVRKERKIRPGFTPQEDVQRFRSTRQQAVESRQNTVVGWISPSRAPTSPPSSSSSRATSAGGGGGAARKAPTSPSGAIARSALAAAGIGATQGGGGGSANSKAARKNEKRREKRREKREAEAEEVAENWDSDEDVGKKDVKDSAGEAKDAAVGNGGGTGAEDEKGKEQDDVGEVADKLGGLAVKE